MVEDTVTDVEALRIYIEVLELRLEKLEDLVTGHMTDHEAHVAHETGYNVFE